MTMTISSVEWGPLGWGFGVDCRRGTVDHLLPNVRTLFPPKSVEVGFSGCFLVGSSYPYVLGGVAIHTLSYDVYSPES